MDLSLIVVDDFFDNADQIREQALKLDYPYLEEKQPYPGRESRQQINVGGLVDAVSGILGVPLKPKMSHGHGKFRVALSNDKGAWDVHVDPGHWSGIYYLSRPEDCRGGTEFFRHIPTGTDRAHLAPVDMMRLGAEDPAEAKKIFNDVIKEHSNDRSKWEHVMTVPMRYNRLVLFRPWFWHTAGPGFGGSLEDGRLVHLLFFDHA